MIDKKGLITAILLLLIHLPVLAWGGDGHQIVALIAEKRLTPAAKSMIADLLDGAELSDAEVASWADEIRRQRRNTAPWHYINIPVDSTGYDPARDGNNGNNVIDAIDRFERILADKSKPKAERAEALKFLAHFIGDMHQPLHCADRSDRGGNSRLVYFLERKKAVNLHSVWDREILLSHKKRTRVADYAAALNEKIDNADAEKWAKGNPIAWANEALKIAADVVYEGVSADGDPPKLDQDYVDCAVPVIDEQLSKAGVRLAAVLNRIAGEALKS